MKEEAIQFEPRRKIEITIGQATYYVTDKAAISFSKKEIEVPKSQRSFAQLSATTRFNIHKFYLILLFNLLEPFFSYIIITA